MIYPISFIENICVHCGKKNTLRFVDKYNNLSKDPIYPSIKIKCIDCDTGYFIRWIPDENDKDKMISITCSDNVKEVFEKDIIKYSEDHRRKI